MRLDDVELATRCTIPVVALALLPLPPAHSTMWLLGVALLGFVVPNGFFVYWLLFEFHGLGPVLQDRLALGFILDVVFALIVLSTYFARRPIGPVRWTWFVVLSWLGGLGFSLPLYYWLNQRRSRPSTNPRNHV